MPAVGGEDVEGDSNGVEPDDEEEERDEGKNEVKYDKRSSEPGEGEDGAFVFGAFEAEEVDDLGGEEDDEAEFGDVVEGKDDVGDAGREHGEDEEEVFREGTGGIDEAEDDAADTEKDEEVVFRGEEAEDDVDKHEDAPEDGPDGRDAVIEARLRVLGRVLRFAALVGALALASIVVLGKVLARMVTIRSRNYCSYFTFV